jgi:FlaA1/EpsC-like NDP-sugar epimerase
VIFSRDEVKHFTCLNLFGNNPKIEYIIGDIRDYSSVLNVTRNADIVFHVAALKRMDGIESNVQEAIKTNVLASLNVFDACVINQVDKVLFISTDKASLPINAYGACKFVSEKIFTNYDRRKITTKFIVTRFGNIIESTGSVIPIFADKIKKGEDLTLTDERMTRFIISKEDASELIFDALRYGIGGEIFVKHLPALKVTDLIEVLKKKFKADNKVRVIGLRPGEKLHEVLVNEFEMARAVLFNNIFVIRPSVADIYINANEELPLYMMRGCKLAKENLYDYSSDKAVVSQDALMEIFKSLNL